MKSYRLDLSRGVNVVADKATLQPGFVTIADGVDLRSGTARPFNSYLYLSDADINDTCIFSYRNKVIRSSDWRDYVAETVAGQDRIYYSSYGGTSAKIIEGTSVKMGIVPPSVAPLVSDATSIALTLNVSQSPTGGIYQTGTDRSYRVAVETIDGVQVPCQAKIIIFTNPTQISTHSATLSWNEIEGALNYWIFAGGSGQERLALKVGIAQL